MEIWPNLFNPDSALKGAPNDIGCPEMEEALSRSDHAAIDMLLTLKGLSVFIEHSGNFSEMDGSRLIGPGLWTQWEVKRGGNYVEC